MNVDGIAIFATVLTAFAGYFFTYFNDLRITRRRERLELITKKIDNLYGPLFIMCTTGRISYEALLEKLNLNHVELVEVLLKNSSEDRSKSDDEILKEWRTWSIEVFIPLNLKQETLIFDNAHLLNEESIPECLLVFTTHMCAYKALQEKWANGDLSEHKPMLNYPVNLEDYARNSYLDLKREQLALIKYGQ